eukprot:Clim_evm7s22 gene=Clim_evmTU7s22
MDGLIASIADLSQGRRSHVELGKDAVVLTGPNGKKGLKTVVHKWLQGPTGLLNRHPYLAIHTRSCRVDDFESQGIFLNNLLRRLRGPAWLLQQIIETQTILNAFCLHMKDACVVLGGYLRHGRLQLDGTTIKGSYSDFLLPAIEDVLGPKEMSARPPAWIFELMHAGMSDEELQNLGLETWEGDPSHSLIDQFGNVRVALSIMNVPNEWQEAIWRTLAAIWHLLDRTGSIVAGQPVQARIEIACKLLQCDPKGFEGNLDVYRFASSVYWRLMLWVVRQCNIATGVSLASSEKESSFLHFTIGNVAPGGDLEMFRDLWQMQPQINEYATQRKELETECGIILPNAIGMDNDFEGCLESHRTEPVKQMEEIEDKVESILRRSSDLVVEGLSEAANLFRIAVLKVLVARMKAVCPELTSKSKLPPVPLYNVCTAQQVFETLKMSRFPSTVFAVPPDVDCSTLSDQGCDIALVLSSHGFVKLATTKDCERMFRVLLPEKPWDEELSCALRSLLPEQARSGVYVGEAHLFFRSDTWQELNTKHNMVYLQYLTRLQAHARMMQARSQYLNTMKAIRTIQQFVRPRRQRTEYLKQREAALMIQSVFRGHRVRMGDETLSRLRKLAITPNEADEQDEAALILEVIRHTASFSANCLETLSRSMNAMTAAKELMQSYRSVRNPALMTAKRSTGTSVAATGVTTAASVALGQQDGIMEASMESAALLVQDDSTKQGVYRHWRSLKLDEYLRKLWNYYDEENLQAAIDSFWTPVSKTGDDLKLFCQYNNTRQEEIAETTISIMWKCITRRINDSTVLHDTFVDQCQIVVSNAYSIPPLRDEIYLQCIRFASQLGQSQTNGSSGSRMIRLRRLWVLISQFTLCFVPSKHLSHYFLGFLLRTVDTFMAKDEDDGGFCADYARFSFRCVRRTRLCGQRKTECTSQEVKEVHDLKPRRVKVILPDGVAKLFVMKHGMVARDMVAEVCAKSGLRMVHTWSLYRQPKHEQYCAIPQHAYLADWLSDGTGSDATGAVIVYLRRRLWLGATCGLNQLSCSEVNLLFHQIRSTVFTYTALGDAPTGYFYLLGGMICQQHWGGYELDRQERYTDLKQYLPVCLLKTLEADALGQLEYAHSQFADLAPVEAQILYLGMCTSLQAFGAGFFKISHTGYWSLPASVLCEIRQDKLVYANLKLNEVLSEWEARDVLGVEYHRADDTFTLTLRDRRHKRSMHTFSTGQAREIVSLLYSCMPHLLHRGKQTAKSRTGEVPPAPQALSSAPRRGRSLRGRACGMTLFLSGGSLDSLVHESDPVAHFYENLASARNRLLKTSRLMRQNNPTVDKELQVHGTMDLSLNGVATATKDTSKRTKNPMRWLRDSVGRRGSGGIHGLRQTSSIDTDTELMRFLWCQETVPLKSPLMNRLTLEQTSTAVFCFTTLLIIQDLAVKEAMEVRDQLSKTADMVNVNEILVDSDLCVASKGSDVSADLSASASLGSMSARRELIRQIIQQCLKDGPHGGLTDEVFLQLVKQTTLSAFAKYRSKVTTSNSGLRNRDESSTQFVKDILRTHRKTLIPAWEVLLCLCAVAKPHDPAVTGVVYAHARFCSALFGTVEVIGQHAKECCQHLKRPRSALPRRIAPSHFEMDCILAHVSVPIKFYSLDGQSRALSVEHDMSVAEAKSKLVIKMGMDTTTAAKESLSSVDVAALPARECKRLWGIYEGFGQLERAMQDHDRILDAIAKWEIYGHGINSMECVRFTFKQQLQIGDFTMPTGEVVFGLVYHQIMDGLRHGSIPFHTEQVLVFVAAHLLQIQLGDVTDSATFAQWEAVLKQFLSDQEIKTVCTHSGELLDVYKELSGYDGRLCKAELMELLAEQWDHLGATVFEVVQYFSSDLPKSLWLVINHNGIHVSARGDTSELFLIRYPELVRYSPSERNIMIISERQGGKATGTCIFHTTQSMQIAALISSYLELMENETKPGDLDLSVPEIKQEIL